MPTHKIANNFIKKYNKDLQIKGYSTLKINEKLKLIEEKLKSLKMDNVNSLKNEWSNITGSYKTKIESNEKKREKQKKKKEEEKQKEIYRSSLKIVPVKKLEEEIKEEKKGDNEKKDTKKVSVNRRERNSLERDFKRTYNKTLYRALEIPNKSNPSLDELKKLCRKLQLKNHPDKGGTKERIQEINDACKILESTIKK